MDINRPSWDEIYMNFAITISERSVDPKYKIGAVAVSKDNDRVLAIGYNGDYAGGPNKRESLETGKSGFIHAEENMLIKLNYSEPYKKVYLTHSPCIYCAKKLINGKIDELIYKEVYDQSSLDWLINNSNIKIRQYEK